MEKIYSKATITVRRFPIAKKIQATQIWAGDGYLRFDVPDIESPLRREDNGEPFTIGRVIPLARVISIKENL